MSGQEALDNSINLSAAYILLLKGSSRCFRSKLILDTAATAITDQCYGNCVKRLNPDAYDLLLQELFVAISTETSTLKALQLALDYAPDGNYLSDVKILMSGKQVNFAISKLLFRLTRDFLRVSSSDLFVGILEIIVKILREKVDHLLKSLKR